MLAFDQGVARFPSLTSKFASMVRSPLWSFTPLAIITASGVIFGARAIFGPSPPGGLLEATQQQPGIPQFATADQPPNSVAGDLRSLTNNDLRAAAYLLNSRIISLSDEYYSDLVKTRKLTSSAERAAARIQVDERFNREFRARFTNDVLRVETELHRRLGADETARPFPSGMLDVGQAWSTGNRIERLARELP
jgi:hypothetical protein